MALGPVVEYSRNDRLSILARVRKVRTRVWRGLIDWLGGWQKGESTA